MGKSSLEFELFLPVRYGKLTSREKLGDGRLPLIWISHDLIRLFLPSKSASQLPTSFLLTPYFYTLIPHTSDIES